MMIRSRLLSILVLLASNAAAQVEIDLATTAADVTIWGSDGEYTGDTIQIGDLNGDGQAEVVFSQRTWRGPAGESGRVCWFFGPLPMPSQLDLRTISPSTCIQGIEGGLTPGEQVQLGDLNGDGIDDVIVGSPGDGTRQSNGAVAVFLGRATWPDTMTFLDADFIFHGADEDDWLRYSVAGDLNGDSQDDLVLFAAKADGPGDTRQGAGEGYIFFGPSTSWPKKVFDLSLDAPDVILYGSEGSLDNPPAGDWLGFTDDSALIADLLGDDIPDLIVAAFYGNGFDNSLGAAGDVYVLRGRSVWPPSIDLRVNGAADLVVYGPAPNSFLTTGAVTDWNGDGVADLLLRTVLYVPPPTARVAAGSVLILEGGSGLPSVWDLATTSPDGAIVGPREESHLGQSIATADVNGDGYVDILVGSRDATPFARRHAGAVFVISGCEAPAGLRDLATDPAELVVYGADRGDAYGVRTRGIDLDGDGRAEIVAGAPASESLGNARSNLTGEVHVIRGIAWSPVCTIAADPGPGADVCGTDIDVTLDASATVVTSCNVTPQYRWMNGVTVVRDWSTDPTVVVRPTQTTVYRLEVRCGDCAGPCFETANVLVTVDADVTPGDLGNTVRAIRSATDVGLSWAAVTEARTYNLYRGTTKGVWPPPLLTGLPLTTATSPDVPGPPDLYFYRVTGASCSGMEGP